VQPPTTVNPELPAFVSPEYVPPGQRDCNASVVPRGQYEPGGHGSKVEVPPGQK
jgi:hypothetical protein